MQNYSKIDQNPPKKRCFKCRGTFTLDRYYPDNPSKICIQCIKKMGEIL